MKKYEMKDLGYKRTPSSAMMWLREDNGRAWEFPVQLVADDRDSNYADEKEDTVGFIKDGSLGRGELADWASNNMNWSDVADYAKCVADADPPDMEEVWGNADKIVKGEL